MVTFMEPIPFHVKDCNLSLIATGESAGSLGQLYDRLQRISTSSLYYHFWGSRLHISFTHPAFHNDFAYWVYSALHDLILAERLTIIDPTEFPDLEQLRQTILDIIEERIDEESYSLPASPSNRFYFLRSIISVFDTEMVVTSPSELLQILPKFTSSSIFYHFIDARRRTPERTDDFSLWLKNFGQTYETLMQNIQLIDPHFSSLLEIRQKLTELFYE